MPAPPITGPSGAKVALARTFAFKLPTVGTYQPPVPLELLDPEPIEARTAVFVATLISPKAQGSINLRLTGAGPVVKLPLPLIGFDQGKLSAANPGFATVLPLDVMVMLPIPPGKRVYGTMRGDDQGIAGLVGASVSISVFTTSLMEPTADGQSQRLIDGFRQAMIDAINATLTKKG